LAWNRAGAAVFGDYARLEGGARNIIHLMSGNLAHRAILADRPSLAASALARFRADSAPYRGDPDFERLIAKLAAVSGEFRDDGRQEIAGHLSGNTASIVRSPDVFCWNIRVSPFQTPRRCALRVYTPVAEGETERKLAVLIRDARHATRAGAGVPLPRCLNCANVSSSSRIFPGNVGRSNVGSVQITVMGER
jgi:hypothetical protein